MPFDDDTMPDVREEIERFDGLDWIRQVRFVTSAETLHPILMRHIAKQGDPAARMALALRSDLTAPVRSILRRDDNKQVRRNLLYERNENGLAVVS